MNEFGFGNPVPGQYHPRTHGSPVLHALGVWADALATRDQTAIVKAGEAILKAAYDERASQDIVLGLAQKLQGAISAVQPPQTSGSESGAVDASDNIDLYQPDPSRFYVLDKRSGLELQEALDDLRVADRYIRRGARPPTRLLFVGAPGTGKTAGGLWLGSQLGRAVALVRIDATVQSSVGGTAKQIRASFEFARDKDAVLMIDEFEAVAVPRNNQGANVGQWSRETTSALLQLLDSLPPEQIVIGATNHLDLIDSAVQRRMRTHILFYPPDRDARATMLKQWWARAPHHGDAKRALLNVTEGYSGDVLERIAESANRTAARRAEAAPITTQDIRLAAMRVLGELPDLDQRLLDSSLDTESRV